MTARYGINKNTLKHYAKMARSGKTIQLSGGRPKRISDDQVPAIRGAIAREMKKLSKNRGRKGAVNTLPDEKLKPILHEAATVSEAQRGKAPVAKPLSASTVYRVMKTKVDAKSTEKAQKKTEPRMREMSDARNFFVWRRLSWKLS